MSVSRKIAETFDKSSWVRRMFEEGARRKALYGAENVCDFSLGNPNLPPPSKLTDILAELVTNSPTGIHGYMPNAGFPETRAAVGTYLKEVHHLPFEGENIVMTVGAAGALNVILKVILNPGEEVLIPRPYFVEYDFYVDNHGGVIKTVETRPDFSLDLDAMAAAIGPRTRAVLMTNPHNPTGRVYGPEEVNGLGALLRRASAQYGSPIYLLSDEPYSKIVYNGHVCPSIFQAYSESFLATSFSKDLSLAGERIGYIAVHPEMADRPTITAGLIMVNRTLGYINAPALMQRLIPHLLRESVDVSQYQRKRDMLIAGLRAAGYETDVPGGTFYLFPKSPIADDIAFVRILQEENILAVPGSGFHGPGHFRIAYCVSESTIERSLPGFRRAIESVR